MSFSIATSGLNAVTEQLNAISNNIANSGTVGFKSGRAEFSALYAESQPLGVGVTGITQSITKGEVSLPPVPHWIWRLTATASLWFATARAPRPIPVRAISAPTATAT